MAPKPWNTDEMAAIRIFAGKIHKDELTYHHALAVLMRIPYKGAVEASSIGYLPGRSREAIRSKLKEAVAICVLAKFHANQ